MIIVSAAIRTLPGRREQFLALVRPMIEATRRENGNIHYELLASIDDENQFMFFEKWSGREALESHMHMPHVTAYVEERNRRGLVEGPSVITTYTVGED